ncbi:MULTISPECIES: hypothetical protein [Candidatus Ichthyocystis]|uniref:Uncharacterized protein n=1 Tax=Candidatus Ichthyocystis hellenicum TaxID=1561003 RepID=A0A0S4M7V4_9BURK|nr:MULTISPECIES: hypothetical protein [Ichthyocystis]CUT17460.1 hypothetical protein Ark11_0624 [Candidatus Ichthyocystis hellenicum]
MLTTVLIPNMVMQPVYPRSNPCTLEKLWRKANPRKISFSPSPFYTSPSVGIFALDGFSQDSEGENETKYEEDDPDSNTKEKQKSPTLAKMIFIPSKNAGIWSSKRVIIAPHSLLTGTIRIDNTLSITAESIASSFFVLGLSALRIAENNRVSLFISHDSYDVATAAFAIAHSMAIDCSPLPTCLSENISTLTFNQFIK